MWMYDYCLGNILQLINQFHTNPSIICEMFRIQDFQKALANLPIQLFYQMIQSDDQFMIKFINDEIQQQQYSAFEDPQNIEEQDEGERAQDSFNNISGIDPEPEGQDIQQSPRATEKVNHYLMIKAYAEYRQDISKQELFQLFKKNKIIQYFENQLYFSLFFQDIQFTQFCWEKIDNQFIQRKYNFYNKTILVISLVESPQILEMIPIQFASCTQLPQQTNKIGMNFTLNQLAINFNIYFDTENDFQTIFMNYDVFKQNYQFKESNQQFYECVNKKQGIKQSILQLSNTPQSLTNLIIHSSLDKFIGSANYEDYIQHKQHLYIVMEKIPFTLEQYHKKYPLTEFQIRLIILQLITIFQYLHQRGLYIGVLTPQQIGVKPTKDKEDQINQIALISFTYSQYKCIPNKLNSKFAVKEIEEGLPFEQSADISLIGHIARYLMNSKMSNNFQKFLHSIDKRTSLARLKDHEWFLDETITKQAIAEMQILNFS